jgi:signal transduction histidine kinase
MGILDKIPTFLTVGVLVIIFICLKRHVRSARLKLWAVGWFLVFTHFLAQLLEPATGRITPLLLAIDLGSLQAAAVAFLVSVSSVVEENARRNLLLIILGVPATAYAVLTCYDVQTRWVYILCLALALGGGVTFLFWVHRKFSAYVAVMGLLCGCAGIWAIRAAFHGSFDEGSTVLLGLGFGLPGVFIFRNSGRTSPAILTMSGGFISWGAVFPVGLLIDRLAPNANIPGELWNTPKLFVAFGMILAILEDKSGSLADMQYKAEALNRQLRRFSAITSRLLSGAKAESMCPEIAAAIVEVSNFSSVEIYLEDGDRRLRVTGSSGMSCPSLRHPPNEIQDWTTDEIKGLCLNSPRLGQNSFLLKEEDRTVKELLIPLCAAGGGYLGCMRLAPFGDLSSIDGEELSQIEELAADLAMAVELKALHRQLVWSEKLAALGQLVAGVAHELNNPLAVIMGYGELISDEITSTRARDQLQKIVGESRRMKKIIENLLRFSRQGAREAQAVNLAPVVQEVLALREYYLRNHNVTVNMELAPDLPLLAVNEDEIKQILLNLLNNSCDALESVPANRRIAVKAWQKGNRAVIEVEDTGPGFANLSRALDPFYTTKPVGRGTGLGLSVCYGIVRERGGDLRIANVAPHGARVIIDLPVAEAASSALTAAVAHA